MANSPEYPSCPILPKKGDLIYIPSRVSKYGRGNWFGGLAMVEKIEEGRYIGDVAMFVVVDTFPRARFNWDIVGPQQEELEDMFEEFKAKPLPNVAIEYSPYYWG
jgi:hypothetical protein